MGEYGVGIDVVQEGVDLVLMMSLSLDDIPTYDTIKGAVTDDTLVGLLQAYVAANAVNLDLSALDVVDGSVEEEVFGPTPAPTAAPTLNPTGLIAIRSSD